MLTTQRRQLHLIYFFSILQLTTHHVNTQLSPPPSTLDTHHTAAATPTPSSPDLSWQDRPCSSLLMGQYKCSPPSVNDLTQTAHDCQPNNRVKVACYPAANVTCESKRFDGATLGFSRYETCRYVTTYHYQTAVLLSVFLGVFGADRFYLGYVGMGVLKLCTCGFMLIGYLFDMLLIITQTLRPVDNSNYIVDYYGQVLHASHVYSNRTFNFTYD